MVVPYCWACFTEFASPALKGAVQGLLWQIQRRTTHVISYTRAPAAQALWGLAYSVKWRTAISQNSGVEALKKLVSEGNRYDYVGLSDLKSQC